MFLEHQNSILDWFLKDHVTLKIGVNKLHFKKYILKIYSYFKLNFVLNYVEYGDAEYVLYKH